VVGATVSLDGDTAGPNESGFEHLFAWFAGGDFEFPSLNTDVQFRRSSWTSNICATSSTTSGCRWSGAGYST